MNILELINLAREKDPLFNTAISNLVRKGRKPNFNWLIRRLESALGRDFVQQAAKAYIEAQNG